MSTSLYIMLASRENIIDKFTVRSIWRKEEDKYEEESILPLYAGSSVRQFMQEMADEHGLRYKQYYLTNPPNLTRSGFGSESAVEIEPYFVSLSHFEQELWTLINNPIQKTEDNEEYYEELVEDREYKINFLIRLIGMVECFDPSYKDHDRYLLYWYE